ncbi:MAG: hypothetical protein LBL83_03765 [Clostridiales bacterium]|nr:hypothetical protein [Clostridiales bacterium]
MAVIDFGRAITLLSRRGKENKREDKQERKAKAKQKRADSEAMKRKLLEWHKRLDDNRDAISVDRVLYDQRDRYYRGENLIEPTTAYDHAPNGEYYHTAHVRNVVAELIEAQVSSAVPRPKVTAKRREDEPLARLIEHMLEMELDRLGVERLGDLMERMVPVQGGAYWLAEWDSGADGEGDVTLQVIHPKQVIPQEGVTDDVESMDYVIVAFAQTKSYIKSRFGVDLSNEKESDPEIRASFDEDMHPAEDVLTLHYGYYRNDAGGIGRFAWVNDAPLEDLEDFWARQLERCADCGRLRPLFGEEMAPGLAGADDESCPYCGGTSFRLASVDYEEIPVLIQTPLGQVLGGTYQNPERVPYYKMDKYPLVLHKNVSIYGQLLGASDVDAIQDQQNTTNRLSQKVIDRSVQSGSVIGIPAKAKLRIDSKDGRVVVFDTPQQADELRVHNLDSDVSQQLAYMAQVYEEARQRIGITDSYQGRRDTTAQSGVAKQFAAAQSAGRLESKRRMKEAVFADLYERIFKLKLAYADRNTSVLSYDEQGAPEYQEFCRYDFLRRDERGDWEWNDDFLFSIDPSGELANNRQSMWQESLGFFQAGAYGNSQSLDALALFWTKMERAGYPDAASTKTYFQRQLEAQQQQQQMMMQQQQMMAQQQAAMQQQQAAVPQQAQGPPAQGGEAEFPPELLAQIDAQAKEAARRDVLQSRNRGE